MPKPRIGLLLGDPCGIGPEVAAKLLARPDTVARAAVLVLGDREVFAAGQRTAGVTLDISEASGEVPEGPGFRHLDFVGREDCPPGQVRAQAGVHVLDLLRRGADLAAEGALDALVFAPLNKQAMAEGGLEQEDELRFLAEFLGCREHVGELNAIDGLWSSRVTSHIPISEVAAAITGPAIEAAAAILHHSLQGSGVAAPRLAISALNPHAGEGGRFGREEIEVIAPAVEGLRARGIDAIGPLPADTVFVRAQREGLHGVVSMFHDQCQIAMKLMGFNRGVTMLAGLPFPVVTAAHGTAFDIVGQGIANPEPMVRAFDMALCLAGAASPGAN
ncbi:MAG: 4-hydroxythreonine-4-phosphate dehydrogenase PdxA [Alphaproteobacteria bacterium]